MINRVLLARVFKSTRIACAFHPLMAAMYIGVAWVLSSEPQDGAGPGSGAVGLITLVLLALLALSPILLVRLARAAFAKGRRRAARDPDSVASKPELLLSNQTQLEYSVWSISFAAGFIAFILGAGWVFFLGCMVVGLVGHAVTFPKWSQIQQYADEYDEEVRLRPTSAT